MREVTLGRIIKRGRKATVYNATLGIQNDIDPIDYVVKCPSSSAIDPTVDAVDITEVLYPPTELNEANINHIAREFYIQQKIATRVSGSHDNFVPIIGFRYVKTAEGFMPSAIMHKYPLLLDFIPKILSLRSNPERQRIYLHVLSSILRDFNNVLIRLKNMEYVHGDLTPQNIAVDSNRCRLRIFDFGAAKHTSEFANRFEEPVGTPYYMAPEAINSRNEYSTQRDMYSFGKILQQFLGMDITNGDDETQWCIRTSELLEAALDANAYGISSDTFDHHLDHHTEKWTKNIRESKSIEEYIGLIAEEMTTINPRRRLTINGFHSAVKILLSHLVPLTPVENSEFCDFYAGKLELPAIELPRAAAAGGNMQPLDPNIERRLAGIKVRRKGGPRFSFSPSAVENNTPPGGAEYNASPMPFSA